MGLQEGNCVEAAARLTVNGFSLLEIARTKILLLWVRFPMSKSTGGVCGSVVGNRLKPQFLPRVLYCPQFGRHARKSELCRTEVVYTLWSSVLF
jgi:hypothetical protein